MAVISERTVTRALFTLALTFEWISASGCGRKACPKALVSNDIPSDWESWPVVVEGAIADVGESSGGSPRVTPHTLSLQRFSVLQRTFDGSPPAERYIEISQKDCKDDRLRYSVAHTDAYDKPHFILQSNRSLALRQKGDRYVLSLLDLSKQMKPYPVAAFELRYNWAGR